MTYSIRRPISTDRNLRREGAVVSSHQTIAAARKALARQHRGAARQGGYSHDYIWDNATDAEYDAMLVEIEAAQ